MTSPHHLRETAYAKINLALHIRRRRSDGYHDLESLFAFAADGDDLSAVPADDLSLTISGPFAGGLTNGDDNLVMRAAKALRAAAGVSMGAALHLDKRLPVASGIGGGSADAAAVLRLLSRLWKLANSDAQLFDIGGILGADVPACIASETVYGDARGDVLTPANLARFAGTPVLLVNPGKPLSTAAIFALWDGIDRGALDRMAPLAGRNDLSAAAISLMPEIEAIIAALAGSPGVTLARMSGSGATCFALFESLAARDAAQGAISAAMPSAWCLASVLR